MWYLDHCATHSYVIYAMYPFIFLFLILILFNAGAYLFDHNQVSIVKTLEVQTGLILTVALILPCVKVGL